MTYQDEKIKRCTKCKRRFVAKGLENDDGELNGEYQEVCEPCLLRIDPKLLHLCRCYQDGFITKTELIAKL